MSRRKGDVWRCHVCGGDDVQTLEWVGANTGKVEAEGPGHSWCNECGEEYQLCLVSPRGGTCRTCIGRSAGKEGCAVHALRERKRRERTARREFA